MGRREFEEWCEQIERDLAINEVILSVAKWGTILALVGLLVCAITLVVVK